jgi:Calx-beta domain/NHL repeat
VTTLAGLAWNSGSADGIGSDARFNSLAGVAVDSAGNVYVADSSNHTIRKGFEADTVQFGRSYYDVVENSGLGSITVTLGKTHTNDVTVDFATSDGSATAGLDYIATNGTITFLPGEMIATIHVPILNDSLVEGPETVNLTLSNPTGGVLFGIPTNAVLTITDNDFFKLDSPPEVNENGGAVTVSVRRSGDTDTPSSVAYYTSDGFQLDNYYYPVPKPAMAGVDYQAVSGILTFAVGQTNKTFTIPILDNGGVDGDRAFMVNLINAFDTISQSPILIHDNELPAVLDFGFDPGSGLLCNPMAGFSSAEALTPLPMSGARTSPGSTPMVPSTQVSLPAPVSPISWATCPKSLSWRCRRTARLSLPEISQRSMASI